MSVGTFGDQKNALDPLEMELQQLWVTRYGGWEIEIVSSRRAVLSQPLSRLSGPHRTTLASFRVSLLPAHLLKSRASDLG